MKKYFTCYNNGVIALVSGEVSADMVKAFAIRSILTDENHRVQGRDYSKPLSECLRHIGGCAFLVRWLSDSKRKIDKLILVAPWKIGTSSEAKKKFYDYPIDETIKQRVNKIVIFTADNEHPDGKRSLEMFKSALGGTVIELEGRGHYTGEDMKTEEFPELLAEVIQ